MLNLLNASVIEIPKLKLAGRFNSIRVEDKDDFLMAFPTIDGDEHLYPRTRYVKKVKHPDKIKSVRKLLEYCYEHGLVPYILPTNNDARLAINIPYALWTGEYAENEILQKIHHKKYNLYIYDLDDSPAVLESWFLIDRLVRDSYELLDLKFNQTGWGTLTELSDDQDIVHFLNVHTFSDSNLIFPNVGIVFFYKYYDNILIHSFLYHGNIRDYHEDDEIYSCAWSPHYCYGDYFSVSLDVFRTVNVASAYRSAAVAYSPGFSFIKWCLESK